MENKNQIVNKDWFTKPKELISSMTPEELILNYDMIQLLNKVRENDLKKAIMETGVNKAEYTLPNGQKRITTISKGGTSIKKEIVEDTDWDLVVETAKKDNVELPYIVTLDTEKVKDLEWFQNNVEKFITKKEVSKKSVSYDRIVSRDIKDVE